jgi:hypothetical protein
MTAHRQVDIVHRNAEGTGTVTVPARQAAAVPITRRDEVWRPARHPSERSIVTYWWAATTRSLVGCRSMDRLTMAMVLDFHPGVVDLSAWSAKLLWKDRGRQRTLVPDFFVRTAAGATVVVVCPPATGPSQRWATQQDVLRQACAEAGWQVGVPRLPTPLALANLRWMARYRHPRYSNRDVELSLLAAFAEPQPLQQGVRATGLPWLSTLPRLYHLLWKRELRMDWSRSMGPATVIGAESREPDAIARPFEVNPA